MRIRLFVVIGGGRVSEGWEGGMRYSVGAGEFSLGFVSCLVGEGVVCVFSWISGGGCFRC